MCKDKDAYNNFLKGVKLLTCPECLTYVEKPRKMREHLRVDHKFDNNVCPWCRVCKFTRMDWAHLVTCGKALYKEQEDARKTMIAEQVNEDKKEKFFNKRYDQYVNRVSEFESRVSNNVCNNPLAVFNVSENNAVYDEDKVFPGYANETWVSEELPEWLTNDKGVLKEDLAFFHNEATFDTRSTGIDAKWIKIFLYKKNVKFWHVSVRRNAWNSFMQIYNENHMYVLPYWCLCEGGRLHHRHMILVTLNFDLSNIWRCIRSENEIGKHKIKFLIDSPMYFGAVVEYMSSVFSNCTQDNILGDPKCTKKKGRCHYFINQPVIPFVNLHVGVLMKENGIETYLRHKHKNTINVVQVEYDSTVYQWYALYKNLGSKIGLDFVLGLSRNLLISKDVFVEKTLPKCFIMINDLVHKLETTDRKFKSNLEWNELQLDNRNCFLGICGETKFILGSKAQMCHNYYYDGQKAAEKRHEAYITELKKSKKEIERLSHENKALRVENCKFQDQKFLVKLPYNDECRKLAEQLENIRILSESNEKYKNELQSKTDFEMERQVFKRELETKQHEIDQLKLTFQHEMGIKQQSYIKEIRQTHNFEIQIDRLKQENKVLVNKNKSLFVNMRCKKRMLYDENQRLRKLLRKYV